MREEFLSKRNYRPARFFLSTNDRSIAHGIIIRPQFVLTRRSGGIGRRAGLKIRWPSGRVGSSPTSGTKEPLQNGSKVNDVTKHLRDYFDLFLPSGFLFPMICRERATK